MAARGLQAYVAVSTSSYPLQDASVINRFEQSNKIKQWRQLANIIERSVLGGDVGCPYLYCGNPLWQLVVMPFDWREIVRLTCFVATFFLEMVSSIPVVHGRPHSGARGCTPQVHVHPVSSLQKLHRHTTSVINTGFTSSRNFVLFSASLSISIASGALMVRACRLDHLPVGRSVCPESVL